MKIYVKNMVSLRCILFVKAALGELNITPVKVELGEIETKEDLSNEQLSKLNDKIMKADLELLENKRDIIVENIKHVMIDYIYNPDAQPPINFSDLLSDKLNYNYNYLSNLFLEAESTPISQYIIKLKIERVKELMLLEEHTLTEIAYELKYSSVAHLSNQFKKVTGKSPSQFQDMKNKTRQAIHEI
ncbi:hypothetical protein BH23BAC3_BH23BAC3_20130 [soil metagenome]